MRTAFHPSSRSDRSAGFTLIELVLVLVVIALAVGVAAPSLRGWNRGSRLRDASEQFITLARLARTQSAATGRTHRLVMGNDGRCFVAAQDGEQFTELRSPYEGSFQVPEGVTLRLTDMQDAPREFVDFFPNGRTQAARLTVSLDDGSQMFVECATPTEGYRVVNGVTR